MGSDRSGSPASRHDHHDPPGDIEASNGALPLFPVHLWSSSPSYVVVWALGRACVAGKTPKRTCSTRFIGGTTRSGHKLEHMATVFISFFLMATNLLPVYLVAYRRARLSVDYWNSRPVHSRRTLRGRDRKPAFPP